MGGAQAATREGVGETIESLLSPIDLISANPSMALASGAVNHAPLGARDGQVIDTIYGTGGTGEQPPT